MSHETVNQKKARLMREWRKKNPERAKAIKKRSISRDPEKYKRMQRNTMYKMRYGISIEQFEEMRLKQVCNCAICGEDPYMDGKSKGLVVDHCHKTGNVRSLLCVSCNLLIGYSQESKNILKTAIKYLEFYNG